MKKVFLFLLKKEIIGTIITIIFLFLILKLIRIVGDKLLLKSKTEFDRKRKKTVIELIKTICKLTVIIIGGIVILDLFGVNVSSFVASLGIASAVSALAFQDTLKDIISGASMIMDNYYVVGDYVKYNDFSGQVIELGLRTTKIVNFDGEVRIIANRNITEITNLSQQTASALVIAPTAYEEKMEKIDKVLQGIVTEILTWETVKKETAYLGIIEFKDSCIDYGIRIYCSPGKIWSYKREVLRLIKKEYDKNKIKIPYNQLEVHNEK